MTKKLGGIAAAIALMGIGTLLLVGYVQSAESRVPAEEEQVGVLVVAQAIEAGDDPSRAVRVEQVPRRLVNPDAVEVGDSFANLVALNDLIPGEQLVWARLGSPDVVESGEPQRLEIPDGMLAVTIPVGSERAIGGLLVPGMRVAIIASFELNIEATDRVVKTTKALVHKALVVEVQTDLPIEPAAPGAPGAAVASPPGSFLVTLAVPISDAERIVYAAEWGRIWLAREDLDADSAGSQIQTASNIFDLADPANAAGFQVLTGAPFTVGGGSSPDVGGGVGEPLTSAEAMDVVNQLTGTSVAGESPANNQEAPSQ